MERLFAWLRPNDLVWNYWVNNYLMGKDPAPFDILYWNADSTNLPARLHAGFMELLLRNGLTRAGAVEILGTPIDLRKVGYDMFVVGGMTDHICAWRAVYNGARLFGGRTEFVLNSSGHVQTLVCPPIHRPRALRRPTASSRRPRTSRSSSRWPSARTARRSPPAASRS